MVYSIRITNLGVFRDRPYFGALNNDPTTIQQGLDAMNYAKRTKEIHDHPWVWLRECRHLLGLGIEKWLRVWEEVYRYEVKHWKVGTGGTQINVESLFQAIYPATKKDQALLAVLSHDFMWRIAEERRRVTAHRRKLRERKESAKNGGNKT